jgi:hydrogenase maturation factor
MHIGASDVAVMGVRPEAATYSLLMPPGTPDKDFVTIVDSIHRAALDLDIAIVGGHTGYYPVVSVPIIGGITVMGVGDPGEIITPAGARPGDAVLMTKGPAIEATGLLALLYEPDLRRAHGDAVTEAALARRHEITVVKDALTACAAGPVTAMHDATEGGVLGGLWEIAEASGVGMEIDAGLMIWPPDVEALCATIGIDPLASIAEGTLLLTVDPGGVRDVLAALSGEGIPCSRIGSVTGAPERRVLRRRDGGVQPLAVPSEDPFWPAFFAGVEKLGKKG